MCLCLCQLQSKGFGYEHCTGYKGLLSLLFFFHVVLQAKRSGAGQVLGELGA